MINRANTIYLNYENYDNRDSYIKKGIDTSDMKVTKLLLQSKEKMKR